MATNKTKIEFLPIGVVHSPFEEPEGTPIQPSRAKGVKGTVEVYPKYAEGLSDLDGFSDIILLYHMHKVNGHRLKVVPFLDTEERGIFATRAPRRPNPIGLSVVKLLAIENNTLTIEGMDMLDGTPVLDIKPYFDEFDVRGETRKGWYENAPNKTDVADDRFKR